MLKHIKWLKKTINPFYFLKYLNSVRGNDLGKTSNLNKQRFQDCGVWRLRVVQIQTALIGL